MTVEVTAGTSYKFRVDGYNTNTGAITLNYALTPTAPANEHSLGAVATGDVDGDGFDDVVVGVPGEDLGAITDAGLVHVFYGTAAGLSATGNQVFHQDTPGVLGAGEPGDRFG